MKTLLIFIAFCGIMTTFPNICLPQNSITNYASVTIVKGITISETSSLNFGTMTIPTAAENLILTTANVRIVSSPSNIELLAQAPVSQNATYTVTGSGGATYIIALPSNGTVTISNGAEHMDIVDFVSYPASAGKNGNVGHLSDSGIDSFTVGATLKLEISQVSGTYTGTFNISVNYNF
jgi:hypothetical protein